jgi:hypothetical protein
MIHKSCHGASLAVHVGAVSRLGNLGKTVLVFPLRHSQSSQSLRGGPMPKFALILLVLFNVAVLASSPAKAAGPAPDQSTAPLQSGPPKGYHCQGEALTGSGPGFKSSRDESEEAAIADWLAKAVKIFADADWNTAKDASLECVVQGLYSKCFATGVPCQPKQEE